MNKVVLKELNKILPPFISVRSQIYCHMHLYINRQSTLAEFAWRDVAKQSFQGTTVGADLPTRVEDWAIHMSPTIREVQITAKGALLITTDPKACSDLPTQLSAHTVDRMFETFDDRATLPHGTVNRDIFLISHAGTFRRINHGENEFETAGVRA